MMIKLVVVSPDSLGSIESQIESLKNAVNTGDMEGMDDATEKLRILVERNRSIELSEKEWREFLARIRAKNLRFESDYLIPGELCQQYFPNLPSNAMVLQLPICVEDS